MKGKWIVVADASRARIFQAEAVNGELHELETLTHPEGRLHEQELTSDLPGRSFDSGGQGRHGMEAENSPKHQELIHFSKFVATHLNDARKSGELKSLYIVAPAEVLGLLRDHLDKNTKAMLVGDLTKNYSTLTSQELLKHLPKPFSNIAQ